MNLPSEPTSSDDATSQTHPIHVAGVVKRYDGKAVLNGIDLQVRQGEIMVIMGPSGCGKSTLLRTLIGSIPADAGSIALLGHDITRADEAQLNAVRKKFGILFQSGALFNSMTLRQNVALPLQEHTNLAAETIEIMVKIKLELVGLREHADKYPSQISGGMKKRAGLARALAMDPQILFYDEPSAGLDPVTSAQIDQLIIALSKQLCVTSVVVTHEMDSAFTIADRMVMLDRGRVLAVNDRAWFENLRDTQGELPRDEALIRQFLRGAADGPLTQTNHDVNYEADLLGISPAMATRTPALQASRGG